MSVAEPPGARTLRAAACSEAYIYALHARLAQIMTDAVHDGLIVKSPCSRRTAPSVGELIELCSVQIAA
jgi:hypothetical protein